MDKQLFGQDVFDIGTTLPTMPSPNKRIAGAPIGALGADNFYFYDHKAILEAQGADIASSEYYSPATYAPVHVVTGSNDIILIDKAKVQAGGLIGILCASAGLTIVHGFDKTSIPEIDRPANYDTLCPIYLATGTDYTTQKADEAITFRLIYRGGQFEFHDWQRPLSGSNPWTPIGTAFWSHTSGYSIDTTVDFTDALQVGDVLKLTLATTGDQFNRIESVSPTEIVVSGVPIDSTLQGVSYETGNIARIRTLIIEMGNEHIFSYGLDVPAVSDVAGGAPSVPTTYGTDVFWAEKINLPPLSYLVGARVTLADCGSSATALELGIGFGAQAGYACEVVCDTWDESPASIVRGYYQVPENNTLLDGVNIETNAGNKDASQVIFHLQFFIAP